MRKEDGKTKKKASSKKPRVDPDDSPHNENINTSANPATGDGEKKIRFGSDIKCPHCGFFITVEAGKIIRKPATPAVVEEYLNVTKSIQTQLASSQEEP